MKHVAVFFTLLLITISAIAETTVETTMVPTLDQNGHRGDIARLAKEKAMAKFDSTDQNKDNKLSKDEVTKSSSYMAQNFDRLDVDKDGSLSWEEFVGHNRWPK